MVEDGLEKRGCSYRSLDWLAGLYFEETREIEIMLQVVAEEKKHGKWVYTNVKSRTIEGCRVEKVGLQRPFGTCTDTYAYIQQHQQHLCIHTYNNISRHLCISVIFKTAFQTHK
jgi:hypothetical protein